MQTPFSLSMKGAGLCMALLLGAAGCATTPIPNERIAVAKASVARAEQAGAVEFAPLEMQNARDKLARAERAVASHDAQPATDLAQQADVDAQLAEATAQASRAHKAAAEFDASLQSLRQESSRSATQPTTP